MHWTYCRVDDIDAQQLQDIYDHLAPCRKEYIDRLRKKEDKNRSLAGELLVYRILQEHYGIREGVLRRRPNGQPWLSGCDLQVSISHSHDLVACAVSREPVGIDVERIRPVSPALCARVCVEEELAYLLAGEKEIPPQDRQDPAFLGRFFEIWTAKEAYFKKCGTGITNLQSVNTRTLLREIFRLEDHIIQII